jgi:hypothetical protein
VLPDIGIHFSHNNLLLDEFGAVSMRVPFQFRLRRTLGN